MTAIAELETAHFNRGPFGLAMSRQPWDQVLQPDGWSPWFAYDQRDVYFGTVNVPSMVTPL
jgi:hypothetical protein